MVAATNPVLLSRSDAAKTLAISERSLFTLTAEGKLPVVRIGRSVRYRPEDLQAFVKECAGPLAPASRASA